MKPLAKSKPRLLFINRSYWPDTEATGQLLTDLCEDLSVEFDITVLSGLPNHLQPGAEMPQPGPDRHGAVRVVRVRHTQFGKHSTVGRLTNLTSFTLSAFLRSMWIERPDILITETDPFFLPLLGRWLKWRYGCKYVAYLQDVYPDIAVGVGKVREGMLTRSLRSLLVAAYRAANRVVVLSRCMARRCERNGVPRDSLRIIPNWVDTAALKPVRDQNLFRQEQQLGHLFTVMYSGNLGVGHLLQPVLEAADLLKSEASILFIMIGEGAQKQEMQDWCAARKLQNVRFLPYQAREFLSHSLSAADVQIVSIRPEIVGCLMPSKLYGVLASGTAVLAISPPDCELAQVVEESQTGIVCNAQAVDLPQQLADAILTMLHTPGQTQEMGQRARALAEASYDRYQVTTQFQQMLQEVLRD